MRFPMRPLVALLALPLLASPGCSWKGLAVGAGVVGAAAVTAAAIYYVQGDLEADIDIDIDEVEVAANKVIEQRGYTRTGRSTDVGEVTLDATIPAAGPEDDVRDLTITLEQEAAETPTHVSIRIGTFGEETLSRLILADIEAELSRTVD